MLQQQTAEIADWLIGAARLSGDAALVTSGFAERLNAIGIPLHLLRIGLRVQNPLLRAWGIGWTTEAGCELYTVALDVLETPAYTGSPVQHVIERRSTFRRKLRDLAASDHAVLHERVEQGFTDYCAVPMEFGDNIMQSVIFATRSDDGFTEDQIAMIEALAAPLSAALEPIAMRRSTASLLATFLGDGPAARVQAGAIRQGDVVETEAAILLTDLRGFTAMSLTLSPDQLLATLGSYFEVIVNAVRAEGGDILKFIGDGVLAIFPIGEAEGDRRAVCAAAVRAASRATAAAAENAVPAFVAALHVGPVTYGNIGSASRLDFTVVGPTVNAASRLETVAKASGEPTVCSKDFAAALPGRMIRSLGAFEMKGLQGGHEVFAVRIDDAGGI